MIAFHIADHSARRGVKVLEIHVDGMMAATIYPEGNAGIKIVSAHLTGVGHAGDDFTRHIHIHDGVGMFPPIPAVHMSFDVGPYSLDTGKVVKDPPPESA